MVLIRCSPQTQWQLQQFNDDVRYSLCRAQNEGLVLIRHASGFRWCHLLHPLRYSTTRWIDSVIGRSLHLVCVKRLFWSLVETLNIGMSHLLGMQFRIQMCRTARNVWRTPNRSADVRCCVRVGPISSPDMEFVSNFEKVKIVQVKCYSSVTVGLTLAEVKWLSNENKAKK